MLAVDNILLTFKLMYRVDIGMDREIEKRLKWNI
jgi:hypothetical protein